jgi:hypothetical protein
MVMPLGRVQVSVTLPTGSDRSHDIETIRHRLDARLRQCEPVDKGAAHAAGFRLSDIFGIGGQNLIRMGADGGRHGGQRCVLLLARGQRQHARRGAPAPSSVISRVRSRRPSLSCYRGL